MSKTLIQEWIDWSVKTFEKATAKSSLQKAKDEIKEIETFDWDLQPEHELLEEYIDTIMALLHSAAKQGFNAEEIDATFRRKFSINKRRIWKLNDNNTYSHILQL